VSRTSWSDVTAAGPEDVELGEARMLAQVRAHRLAEIRKRRGLTQRDVAPEVGVTVGRVSQIESGDISGIDVLGPLRHRHRRPAGNRRQLRRRAVQGRIDQMRRTLP
jgi:predicted XRE-type DNA-binding protein